MSHLISSIVLKPRNASEQHESAIFNFANKSACGIARKENDSPQHCSVDVKSKKKRNANEMTPVIS